MTAGPASAAEQPVASASLSLSPTSASWPSAKTFQGRLEVSSGPDGADTSLGFPYISWGFSDVSGSPFTVGDPTLEGAGSIKLTGAVVADPSPTACFRGNPGYYEPHYNLKMPPDSQAAVVFPVSLASAPLVGMNSEIKALLGTQTLSSPVQAGGTPGMRIIGKVSGGSEFEGPSRLPGETFRISGRTVPAVANRLLRFRVDPRMSFDYSNPPKRRVLATVRTDASGRFRTAPVALNREAVWVLTSTLVKPGYFDPEPSCNGSLLIDDGFDPATLQNLDAHKFVSTSIKGPGKKPKKITLYFTRGRIDDETGEIKDPNGPIMILDAGCNSIGGEYDVRNGRLGWTGDVIQTLVGCVPDRDGWLASRLRGRINVSIKGKTLLLKGKRGVRVTLKRAGAV